MAKFRGDHRVRVSTFIEESTGSFPPRHERDVALRLTSCKQQQLDAIPLAFFFASFALIGEVDKRGVLLLLLLPPPPPLPPRPRDFSTDSAENVFYCACFAWADPNNITPRACALSQAHDRSLLLMECICNNVSLLRWPRERERLAPSNHPNCLKSNWLKSAKSNRLVTVFHCFEICSVAYQ